MVCRCEIFFEYDIKCRNYIRIKDKFDYGKILIFCFLNIFYES